MTTNKRRNAAFLVALTSIILLSSNATVAIIAADSIHFFLLSCFATGLTAVILGLRSFKQLFQVARKVKNSRWFWLAIVLKFVNDIAFYYSVMASREIEVTIIVYLYPLFNIILGSVLLNKSYRRLKRQEWVLVLTSFVSVVLLTPLSAFSNIAPTLFVISLLSAMASVYLVLLQLVSDQSNLEKSEENSIVGLLFLGSFALHLIGVVMVFLFYAEPAQVLDISVRPSWVGVICVIWIALAVNIGSETLWLRAARTYESVGLKSLFYLSPVFGASYMVLLGIDTLDTTLLFCMTGVVVCNILIHRNNIEDLSFIIFLFALFTSAVFLKIAENSTMFTAFSIPENLLQIQISFVTFLAGFLLFRAFEIHQRCAEAYYELILASVEFRLEKGLSLEHTEEHFKGVLASVDFADWVPKSMESPDFRQSFSNPKLKDLYLRFYTLRTTSLTMAEVFLMFLICGFAALSLLIDTISSHNSSFVASLLIALFVFLPFLMVELAHFRFARMFTGQLVRRIIYIKSIGVSSEVHARFSPKFNSISHNLTRWIFLFILASLCCLATWVLLEVG